MIDLEKADGLIYWLCYNREKKTSKQKMRLVCARGCTGCEYVEICIWELTICKKLK